jgi:hypothetical protein
MATWSNAYLGTLTADSTAAANNTTIRIAIPSAGLSNTGQNYVRVTFRSALTEGLELNPVYIGQRATAGDDYDFAAAPTQLTFSGGSAGFSIGTNATIVSDVALFSIPAGQPLIISFYENNTSLNGFRTGATNAGSSYFKAGNDCTTVNATGYSGLGVINYSVQLIEAGYDSAFMPMVIFAD